ncbi:hypothetical protein [Soonwooa sp.]|uniref:hypothetical protein n=1 Tax=Soonwooa sp. TaxID=1938592 RepID=UPI0026179A5F|nr:hypothetical protein [Soonwooa sp.]
MKTNLLIAGVLLSLVTVSCKKSEGGNKDVISESSSSQTTVVDNNGKVDSVTTSSSEQNVNGNQTQEVSVPYKGLDGTRAKATFTTDKSGKTIMIEANNNKFQLDLKSKSATGEHYERNGVSAVTKGDSLIISQGNTVIPLVKVK